MLFTNFIFSIISFFSKINSPGQPGVGEQRQAHFRTLSPAHPQTQSPIAPQTGLGLLMGGGVQGGPASTAHQQQIPVAPTLLAPNPNSTSSLHYQPLSQPPPPSQGHMHPAQHQHQSSHQPQQKYVHLTPEQQKRIQDDLADRERQASSLAAAGMVAESVNLTRPAVIGQVLQAPPPLVGMAPPAPQPTTAGGPNDIPMEGINWNLADLGASPDDIDMDFAAMFEPEQEQSTMQTMEVTYPPHQPQPPNSGAGAPPAGTAPVHTEEHGTPNPLGTTSV